MFRTVLTETLGIKYPIIQAGMGGVAIAELVAAVSNAGGRHRLRLYGIDHLGHQGQRANATGVAAALVALGEDNVDASLGHAASVLHVTHHRHHLHAALVHFGYPLCRVAQARDEDRHALREDSLHHLRHAGHAFGQQEVYGEGLVRHVLDLADLLAELCRAPKSCPQGSHAASVGDGGRQVGGGHAPHPRLHDGILDPQNLR